MKNHSRVFMIWFKRSYDKNSVAFSANFASYSTYFALMVFFGKK